MLVQCFTNTGETSIKKKKSNQRVLHIMKNQHFLWRLVSAIYNNLYIYILNHQYFLCGLQSKKPEIHWMTSHKVTKLKYIYKEHFYQLKVIGS